MSTNAETTSSEKSRVQSAATEPLLADRTPLRDMVDMETRTVSARVMTDPEIFRLELQRLFAGNWTILAHESEVRDPGSFVVRSLGLASVIVTRNDTGELKVLLNVCTHRGAKLCILNRGKIAAFTCPSHGWTFNGSGELIAAPFDAEMEFEDKSKYKLRQVSVAVRRGVIFGNFNPNPPPIDQYLGEGGWYFDQTLGTDEMEVLDVEEANISVRENWKTVAEQYMAYARRYLTSRESDASQGLKAQPTAPAPTLYDVKCQGGHRVLVSDTDSKSGKSLGRAFVIGQLFPGSTFSRMSFQPTRGGETLSVWAIGAVVPTRLGQLRCWSLGLVPKYYSEEMRAQARQYMLSNAMIIPQDSRHELANQKTKVFTNATFRSDALPKDWPGLGAVNPDATSEDSRWEFWVNWLSRVTG